MAKGKSSKADQRRAKARGLERDTYLDFMALVAEKKQDLADAQMAHAGEWKKADPLGIHADVAKVFAKLDKMEPTKRTDWLRAFDTYRPWYTEWTAQPDMFEARSEQEEREPSEREERPLDLTEREPVAVPDTEAVLQEQAEEEPADPVDDTAAEATEELAGAGFTFAAGRQAALNGEAPEANPHPEGTPSHPIWARGHAQGLRGKDEAESETVVPLAGARRGRRTEAAAAVH